MQQQNKKRLFIALNLPNEIKQELISIINKLAKNNRGVNPGKITGVKWVKPEDMHLTLHFLGYIDADTEEQIKLAMQSFQGKFGKLQFELGKINAFPNLTRPRVIFIECNQVNSKSIFKLQELLGEKLIQLGIRVDQRPWKPHLTLGRIKEKCNLKIGGYKIKTKEFTVDFYELMESELTPAGAKYKIVETFFLS